MEGGAPNVYVGANGTISMRKRKLPHIRRFLKQMPQLAMRGTTEEHLPSEVFGTKRGKINAEPNFILTRKITFKRKTRDAIKMLYLSVQGSIDYALSYSEISFPTAQNGWKFGKPKNKPVLLLAIDPLRKMQTSDVDWHDKRSDEGSFRGENRSIVRGSNLRYGISSGPMLGTKLFEKSEAHYVKLPITSEDFRATEKALQEYIHRQGPPLGIGIAAGYFITDYLTKRMIRKAIPFIRKEMPTKK